MYSLVFLAFKENLHFQIQPNLNAKKQNKIHRKYTENTQRKRAAESLRRPFFLLGKISVQLLRAGLLPAFCQVGVNLHGGLLVGVSQHGRGRLDVHPGVITDRGEGVPHPVKRVRINAPRHFAAARTTVRRFGGVKPNPVAKVPPEA